MLFFIHVYFLPSFRDICFFGNEVISFHKFCLCYQVALTISDKNYWKTAIWTVFISPPSLTPLTMLRKSEQNLYIRNKLVTEKWVKCISIFLWMRKTCRNLVLQEKLVQFNHTAWLFYLFKVSFWFYNWLNSG